MVYTTQGTCSRQITFDVVDNKLTNVRLYSAMGRPVKQRNIFLLNGCNFPGKPAKMNSALIFQI